MKNLSNNKKGFTLIELLVLVPITAILGVLPVFPQGVSVSSTIVGGVNNVLHTANISAILGGDSNRIFGSTGSSIVGGFDNFVVTGSDFSTIAGGYKNTVFGNQSFAAGNQAKAMANNTFVWNGDETSPFTGSKTGTFVVNAPGGVGMGVSVPEAALDVNGAVKFGNSTATGCAGQIKFSGNAFYGCTGSNRALLLQ